jgi:hypothetical protein
MVNCTSIGAIQGMLPVSDPRPSTRVLGRVLGILKYPTTYSSNVEFSTLVPVTYSSVSSDPIYLPDTVPKKCTFFALTPVPKKMSTFNTNSYARFYVWDGRHRPITSTMASAPRENVRFNHTIGAPAFRSMGISYINVMRKFGLFERRYYGFIIT